VVTSTSARGADPGHSAKCSFGYQIW
jgi:hypothetical protein